jgi:hypothetical protein
MSATAEAGSEWWDRNFIGNEPAVLRAFNPVSWFHPRGIHRVLARLRPRLPDVSGKLFLTFTFNPLLYTDPLAAFEHGRDRLRPMFFRLRRGVVWEGKRYVVDAPYSVKLEFHKSGWAHFHVVFLTRSFVPGGLLNALWGLGRVNVQRISNRTFHYLLKYVTKGGGLPEWILGRTRVRVFQSSKGFLTASAEPKTRLPTGDAPPAKRTTTLGERLERWRKTAVIECRERFQQVILSGPFFELMSELVFPSAVEGRYLGGGQILINDVLQLEPWIT